MLALTLIACHNNNNNNNNENNNNLGVLLKQGHNRKSWKTRFIVLFGSRIQVRPLSAQLGRACLRASVSKE
jgi:hypothetical protein